MKSFRDGVAKADRTNVTDYVQTYVYELNLLMRLAATFGITVTVDTVERHGYTEIVVSDRG